MNFLNKRGPADVMVLPFWQGKKHAETAAEMKEFSSLFALPVDAGDFLGKEGETLFLYDPKRKEKRLLLVGLGEKKEFSLDVLRRAFAAVVKTCQSKKLKHLNVLLLNHDKENAQLLCEAICEGILLANYSFDKLKGEAFHKKPPTKIEKVAFIGADAQSLALCKKRALIIESVNFARDLVNGNADDVTPQALAAAAQDLAKTYKTIKTTILGKKEIEKEKLGLLLAVNRGSAQDPVLVVMEYRGDPKSKERTALVGKGICFDTGGLNIKPTGNIETMKDDMSGAAAVLGTLRAAAAIGLKANLIGVVVSTENAIGPNCYKPGDVYWSHSGKTIEISNTDAEGRLVLADALSYLQTKFEPTRIVDLATLTGGVIIALGEELTGLFSNNDLLAKQLIRAGEKTYERLWRLPMVAEYKELLKSSIADLKNSGGRKASSASAAVFLKEFIHEGTPWAHLDIAGTAYLSAPQHYHTTHATGVGVRLLIEWLEVGS